MEKEFKVKIINSSNCLYWYTPCIGHIFTVANSSYDHMYKTIIGGAHIHKSDCEIIEQPKEEPTHEDFVFIFKNKNGIHETTLFTGPFEEIKNNAKFIHESQHAMSDIHIVNFGKFADYKIVYDIQNKCLKIK